MKILFILVFALAGLCPPAYALNLIQNPSFEEGGNGTALDWQPYGSGYGRYLVTNAWDGQAVARLVANLGNFAGVSQRVVFNQTRAKPVLVTAEIRSFDVPDVPSDIWGASLYAEVHYVDVTTSYTGNTARTKNVGTSSDWRLVGFNTASSGVNKPIAYIDVIPLLGKFSTGSAWIDSVQAVEYDPGRIQGAVTVMVDDGELSTYSIAYAELKKRGWVGTTAVVTSYVGTIDHMTYPQLTELQNNGWEIASHSAAHIDLTTTTLSSDHVWAELHGSKVELEAHGLYISNFVWPFGAYNQYLIGLGRWDYKSMRGVERGYNPVGAFPYDVKIQEVDFDTPLATIFGWIDYAKANHIWLVLVFHSIVAVHDDNYYTTPVIFGQIMDHIQSSGLPVVTYDQGLDLVDNPNNQSGNAASDWEMYR